jgi:hypothetical protein
MTEMLSGMLTTLNPHNFLHKNSARRVYRVFAEYMKAASRDFFREDGARHNQYAKGMVPMHAFRSGCRPVKLCVNSCEHTIAVSGERITPASTPPVLTSGHISGLAPARKVLSTAPWPAPIMSKGASTPPNVPGPKEMAQIRSFTTSRLITAVGGKSPYNNPSIAS